MAKTPAWQRKEGQSPSGGLNAKGRASAKAEGHNLKPPQPEGGSRKNSFCARMTGMKEKLTSKETANDPDSRINKSLRKWNCHADGGPVWDKPRPKKLGKPEPLSSKEKKSAKAMAKAAGRPYPNLVDNMRAARAYGGVVDQAMEFVRRHRADGGFDDIQQDDMPYDQFRAERQGATPVEDTGAITPNQSPLLGQTPPVAPVSVSEQRSATPLQDAYRNFLPTAPRVLAESTVGGMTTPITEKDFSTSELDYMRQRIENQNKANSYAEADIQNRMNFTPKEYAMISQPGDPSYEQWQNENLQQLKSYENTRDRTSVGYDPQFRPTGSQAGFSPYQKGTGSPTEIAKQIFTNPAFNVATTLGHYTAYDTPKGRIVLDNYNFDPMPKNIPTEIPLSRAIETPLAATRQFVGQKYGDVNRPVAVNLDAKPNINYEYTGPKITTPGSVVRESKTPKSSKDFSKGGTVNQAMEFVRRHRQEGGKLEGDVQFAPSEEDKLRQIAKEPSYADYFSAPLKYGVETMVSPDIAPQRAMKALVEAPETAKQFAQGAAQSAYSGATLPGDVAMGRVDPMSDEGFRRAQELAGLAQTGSFGFTRPAGSLASGASRPTGEFAAAERAMEARAARKAGAAWELMTPEQRKMFMSYPDPELGGTSISEANPQELLRQERANEQGYTGPWYHGTQRLDRLLEGKSLNPKRATSGPMPFFTDDPEVASRYAIGKQDTSRIAMDEGNPANYFTVNPKELGISGRNEIPVEQSWHYLPQETKQRILENYGRIGYANRDEAVGDLVLHPEFGGLSSPSHYDYILKREARGNPLTALRNIWYEGGDLYNNPEQLADIYRLAGYPHPISQKNAPWTEAQGVMPAMLRMENPLTTHNVKEINEKVIPHLEQAFAKDRTKKPTGSNTDMWDKNYKYTPKEWVAQLKEDMAKGDNSYAWTSIPDKVTQKLKELGYDGIIDTGGKMGGQEHRVAIPFHPHQVRSKFAKFNPKHLGKADLLKSHGGEVDNAMQFVRKNKSYK